METENPPQVDEAELKKAVDSSIEQLGPEIKALDERIQAKQEELRKKEDEWRKPVDHVTTGASDSEKEESNRAIEAWWQLWDEIQAMRIEINQLTDEYIEKVNARRHEMGMDR